MNDFNTASIKPPSISKDNPTVDSSESGRIQEPTLSASFFRSIVLLVGIPTLLAATYFGLIASDVYISETRYAIRTNDRAPTADLITAVLAPSGFSTVIEDSKIVRDYILSRDMLEQLSGKLDLRTHYGSSNVDWFSRLNNKASEEDFLRYYRRMVSVTTDGVSGITTLRARAFDASTAQTIASTVIELSEVLINRWSERITEDTLSFSRRELEAAELKVREASEALTHFRNQSRSIDPGEETSALLKIITGLESQLADTRAELVEKGSFLRADSPQIITLSSRVAALENQIELQRSRLAGESGTHLTRIIDGYAPLVLDQQLAEKQYASALTSLELARADAQRKQRYLIPFVKPELPDEALEPKRAWNILTVFIGSLLVYGIGSLIWAAVVDHLES